MEDPASASNTSLIPSAMDLLLVVPRLAQRAGSFAMGHMPEAVFAGKMWNGGSVIADATAQQTVANMTITNTSDAFAQNTGTSMLQTGIREVWNTAGSESSSSLLMSVGNGLAKIKNVGGIFSYLTSRWALTTFVVVSRKYPTCGNSYCFDQRRCWRGLACNSSHKHRGGTHIPCHQARLSYHIERQEELEPNNIQGDSRIYKHCDRICIDANSFL